MSNNFFERVTGGSIGVKICGITNPEDALLSMKAGADALGFNFFSESKRFLEIEKERPWLEKLSDSFLRVAVVVNPTLDEALGLAIEPFIDAIQLHGDETVNFCEELRERSGKPVIKALRIRDAATLREAEDFTGFPVLLDAFVGHERGGTGQSFDWKWLENFSFRDQIILSGGLAPENITAALRLTKVKFVDVASGVEENPRKKSGIRVCDFISHVREFTA